MVQDDVPRLVTTTVVPSVRHLEMAASQIHTTHTFPLPPENDSHLIGHILVVTRRQVSVGSDRSVVLVTGGHKGQAVRVKSVA